MFVPDPTLLSAEVRPSQAEQRPVIGPNLAQDNEDLCREVAQHISTEFFVPYFLMMERLFPIWERCDNMWRCTQRKSDLDVGQVQRASGDKDNQAQAGGFGMTNFLDNSRAKVSPAAAHKQMDAILNLGESVSFEDGDLPLKARKPDTVYEHPLFNPTTQAAEAANEEFRRQSEEIDLRLKHRIAFGSFVKYGHAFALCDFARQLETIECRHVLPSDFAMVNPALMQLRTYYRYPENRVETDEIGRQVAVFLKTVPKVIRTNYIPLDVSSVFIDDLIPCSPMERQPCPIVKMHITKWEVEENHYDPMGNPFGWVNVEKAIKADNQQFTLSQPEEQELRSRLEKRWGAASSPGIVKPEYTIHQLWTAYAMLAIDPKSGRLDKGDGVHCVECDGKGAVPMEAFDEEGFATTQQAPCEHCQGSGKVRIKSERYVVQMYGSLYSGNVTVLRIQRNPTAKDKVPILYGSHLPEDTATARPVSKAEIAMSAYQQLATGHNQFLDSKSRTINRPWMKRVDSLAYNFDCNRPNGTIPIESSMENEVRRTESNQYDETVTLIPYMQMEESEVRDIFGANDTVIGEISAGRRPSSEIQLASEGSKRPLIQQIDRFNGSHMRGWGQFVLDNLEAWMDMDWMLKRTGRPTWGKLELFTAVGEELLSSQSAIAQYRYVLEAAARIPQLQMIVPKILGKMCEAMKLPISMDDIDQGVRKSQQEAFFLITKILGEGAPIPPNPDDPDEVFCEIFRQQLREIQMHEDNFWRLNAPQNIPLLMERLQMQEMQLQTKMMAQMQAQIEQQALMAPTHGEEGESNAGNEPKRPPAPPNGKGAEMQHAQGANQ